MYYPYLRGKQYELTVLQEKIDIIVNNNIVPVIEPVKENRSVLEKTIEILRKENAKFVLILNPKVGDFKNNSEPININIIEDILKEYSNYSIGYILNENSSLLDIKDFLLSCEKKNISMIHCGFPKGKELKTIVSDFDCISEHIFIENYSGKLYQKNFKTNGVRRILIRDGFKKTRNADYPDDEHFSDLHATYEDEGMDGFGDFLIVGNHYSEAGGPAYAIAIHLTYINDDDDMHIKHFKSDVVNTPANPSAKFLEALEKLNEYLDDDTIFQADACLEFKNLYNRSHYPGLGIVKKLSMIHHIELMADFIKKN